MFLEKSKTYNYLMGNKKNLVIILLLIFISYILVDINYSPEHILLELAGIIISFFLTLVITGYGLAITKDVTYKGDHLPDLKIMKSFVMGIKLSIIAVIYLTIQTIILIELCDFLAFPDFELEELILNFGETIGLFISHEPMVTVLFIILGILFTYITTFFMEIALAMLADDGSLIDSLNIMKIKATIDAIGWKFYAIDYTKIIMTIILLSFLRIGLNSFHIFTYYIDVIFDFLLFTVEFLGIGYVYSHSKKDDDEEENHIEIE